MKKKLLTVVQIFIFSQLVFSYECFKTGYSEKNNKIYYYDGVKQKKVPKADVNTFRQLYSFIERDGRNVYFGAKVIKGLDFKTLEVDSDVMELEEIKPVIFSYECFKTGYLEKNNKIYYYDGVKQKKVPKADASTFRQLYSFIGRDSRNVYFGAKVIKGLDFKTLEVYSDVMELEEIKPEVTCYPVIDIRFRDKNGIYRITNTESGIEIEKVTE